MEGTQELEDLEEQLEEFEAWSEEAWSEEAWGEMYALWED
jgi:hypothetical protein